MAAQLFIDHLTLPVRDLEASKRFYRQAHAPFGIEEVEVEGAIGWGPPGRVDFFIRPGGPSAPLHLAFEQRIGRRSTPSTRRRSPRAEPTTARPGRGRATTRTTTAVRDRPRRPQSRGRLPRARIAGIATALGRRARLEVRRRPRGCVWRSSPCPRSARRRQLGYAWPKCVPADPQKTRIFSHVCRSTMPD
jgi:catechol 2,3-dioxygenase-like lactoylglutathione lyase family enzyme